MASVVGSSSSQKRDPADFSLLENQIFRVTNGFVAPSDKDSETNHILWRLFAERPIRHFRNKRKALDFPTNNPIGQLFILQCDLFSCPG
jgi:hypothetical protein